MASTAHFNKADAQKTPPLPLLPVDNEASELTILLKAYLKTKDIQKIWDAYRFSEEAHHGQSRRSGEPYIVHPVAVACTLANFILMPLRFLRLFFMMLLKIRPLPIKKLKRNLVNKSPS